MLYLRRMKKKVDKYNPSQIEPYWQKVWSEEKIYEPDLKGAKKPFYNLMMFPYPSAEGLHVGSFFTYAGIDAYGRFKRMQGLNVFEPIGLDGFGIHSENYALKVGRTPQEHARISEENFYRQLQTLGNGFAWMHKLETYDPSYYKWTQWLFTELFKKGLAYKAKAPVNFCPSCKTVLADEQVVQKSIKDEEVSVEGERKSVSVGVCERCGSEVEKKELEQWFFKITSYADLLLDGLTQIDWDEKVKIAQRNWIGRKEGATIEFKLADSDLSLEVFTTRPDTLYGATFLVVSPEHKIVTELINSKFEILNSKLDEVRDYVERTKKTETGQRETKEKTGIFSGMYALHPLTGEKMPVWVADYVLGEYGTGAIMAVPSHDERDFEFARKHNLATRQVVRPIGMKLSLKNEAYSGEGFLINSGSWNNLYSTKDLAKIIKDLEDKKIAQRKVTYHLRDWLISRQRYWGPPIPMIYCKTCAKEGKSWFTTEEAENYRNGLDALKNKYQTPDKEKIGNWKLEIGNSAESNSAGWYPVPLKELPVKLPYIEDYRPVGTGKAPLANHPEFYRTTCPACGAEAVRETDVSDTFLDSAWYFLRYPSSDIEDRAFDPVLTKKWLPVDSYIGGAEHAVLHLLYARFITMVLFDLGLVDFREPFVKFRTNGLIIKDGAKMSKSRGNVINPDEYVKKYGADTLRLYLAFIGPFSQGGDFRDTGIEGTSRFLKRVWKLFSKKRPHPNPLLKGEGIIQERLRMMHQTIKGITDDMESLRFNTAIAKLMTYYNFLADQKDLALEEAETFLKLLSPFAPHLTEELYQQLFNKPQFNSIHTQKWPLFEESMLDKQKFTIVVQVNGKRRGEIELEKEEIANQKEVVKKVLADPRIKRYAEQGTIKRQIYLEGKLLNFVIE